APAASIGAGTAQSESQPCDPASARQRWAIGGSVPIIGFACSGHGAAPALQRHPKRIGPGSAMRRFRTMLRIALAAHCVRGTIVETLALAVIAPARRRRAARRPRYQQRECKADAAGDQQRAERVVLHLLGNHLRTVAESLAAV